MDRSEMVPCCVCHKEIPYQQDGHWVCGCCWGSVCSDCCDDVPGYGTVCKTCQAGALPR